MEIVAIWIAVLVVPTDLEMPRLDGYGLLACIRAEPTLQQLPAVMLPSRTAKKHRTLVLNLGASAYWGKPYRKGNSSKRSSNLPPSQALPPPRWRCHNPSLAFRKPGG